jgi:hypothetical protein
VVFLDRAVVLGNCESSAAEGFSFCAKTLIIHEDGSSTLILKEPCTPGTRCEHISLLTRNFIQAEQELPYSLRVSLRHVPTSHSDTNGISDQEHLTLTVVQAGFGLSLRTLVFNNQGTCKQHSIKTPLEVISVLDDEVDDREETNFALMGFSRVPCFFCGKDALRPLLDGGGEWGFLVYSNISFGYSCDRCKERTWVSAGRFGPSGVGGVTTWGSRRT